MPETVILLGAGVQGICTGDLMFVFHLPLCIPMETLHSHLVSSSYFTQITTPSLNITQGLSQRCLCFSQIRKVHRVLFPS